MEIKNLIHRSHIICQIISLGNNLLSCPTLFFNKKFISFKGAFIRGLKIRHKGQNNKILIGEYSFLHNCKISISGCNNTIIIGENVRLSNASFWIEGNDNLIELGSYTTIEGGEFATLEGTSIRIGTDCMFSHSIEFRISDSHMIYDMTGIRINPAKSIVIGNHVWLGAHVKILKGAQIASESIVGIGAIVTSPLLTPNSIYAGIPARKIKENITWSRN